MTDPLVTPGKAGAAITCRPDGPCDVSRLRVKVSFIVPPYGEQVAPREITVVDHALSGLPAGVLRFCLPGLESLMHYDLVIDAIADFDTITRKKAAPPSQKVKIEAHADYLGEPCPKGQHPLMSLCTLNPTWWKNADEGDPSNPPAMVKDLVPTYEYKAAPAVFDMGQKGDISGIFNIITYFMFPPHDPKLVEIHARSCGRRTSGTTNHHLIGLVRIFRKDKWDVNINVPPLFRATRERSGMQEYETSLKPKADVKDKGFVDKEKGTTQDGNVRRAEAVGPPTTTGDAPAGRAQTPDPFFVRAGQIELAERNKGSHPGASAEELARSHPDFVGTAAEYDEHLAKIGREAFGLRVDLNGSPPLALPSNFRVTITENEEDRFDSDKALALLKELFASEKKINSLQDALKVKVQVGFKWSLSLSLFQGIIIGRWEPVHLKKIEVGRYLRVKKVFSLHVKMTLIDLLAEASFGFEAHVGGASDKLETGLAVMLKATMGITASVDFELTNSGDQPTGRTDKMDGFARVEFLAYIRLLGYTIGEVNLRLQVGFQLEYSIKTDEQGNIIHKGILSRKPLEIVGLAYALGGGPPVWSFKKELAEGDANVASWT